MGGAPATRAGLKCGRGRGKASRRLAMPSLLWQEAERLGPRPGCCSSSVVEHSLGKGEVESSILSCSTSYYNRLPFFYGARIGAQLPHSYRNRGILQTQARNQEARITLCS
jgi:hypothetical protein